jgi:hypothetical protein
MQRSLTLALVLLSAFPFRSFAQEPDSDHDGLDDAAETALGTNPNDRDTDHDGLSDGAELDRQTNPFDSDTDGGGGLDGDEINLSQDPLNPDDDVIEVLGPGDFFVDCLDATFA